MASLRVISAPGLSARMLKQHARDLPNLRTLFAATVIVLEGASTRQLEAALVTGLLPEYHNRPGVLPFWHAFTARVKTEHPHPESWRAWARKDVQLDWRTVDASDLRAMDAEAACPGPFALLSAWAQSTDGSPAPREGAPLDRPVLLTRGIEQPRECVGILEVAGILQRALTGEVLHDAS